MGKGKGCSDSKLDTSNEKVRSAKQSHKIDAAIERQLLASIMEVKRKQLQSKEPRKSSFNTLMLQFPKMRAGFLRAHGLFKQMDKSGSGMVDFEDFRAAMPDMGFNPQAQAIKDVVELAQSSGIIFVNRSEFVLLIIIIILRDADKKAVAHPEIVKALDVMERAFTFFDSSCDGQLEKKELAMALKSGTRVFGQKRSISLSDKLFDALDWDHSGRITFKEFVSGIERMVVEDWDDGDEDPDEMEGDFADDEPAPSTISGAVEGADKVKGDAPPPPKA